MIVFDIIWNIIGILFSLLGLLLCSMLVFVGMALVASLGDKKINVKKKGTDDDGEKN